MSATSANGRRYSYRLLSSKQHSKEKTSLEEALREEDKKAKAPNAHAKRARFAQDLFGRLNNLGLGPIAGLGQEISRSIAESFEGVSADYARLPKDAQAVVKEATKMVIEATSKKHTISEEDTKRLDELFKELLKTVGKYKGRGLASIEAKINELALQINQIVTSLLFEKDLTGGAAKHRRIVVKSPKRRSPRKSPMRTS